MITTHFDHEGNVVREQGSGRIVEQITRLDDQGEPVRSITRNISGPGTFTFDEDAATLVARDHGCSSSSPASWSVIRTD